MLQKQCHNLHTYIVVHICTSLKASVHYFCILYVKCNFITNIIIQHSVSYRNHSLLICHSLFCSQHYLHCRCPCCGMIYNLCCYVLYMHIFKSPFRLLQLKTKWLCVQDRIEFLLTKWDLIRMISSSIQTY